MFILYLDDEEETGMRTFNF